MGTYKYHGVERLQFPVLGVSIAPDDTIEVPEWAEAQFDAHPDFTSSKVKNPDITTGSIPIVGAPENIPA